MFAPGAELRDYVLTRNANASLGNGVDLVEYHFQVHSFVDVLPPVPV